MQPSGFVTVTFLADRSTRSASQRRGAAGGIHRRGGQSAGSALATAPNANAANTFRNTVNQTGRALVPNALLPVHLAVWDGHVAMVVGNGMAVMEVRFHVQRRPQRR